MINKTVISIWLFEYAILNKRNLRITPHYKLNNRPRVLKSFDYTNWPVLDWLYKYG